MSYLNVSDYARKEGKTRQAIYALIKRGRLQAMSIAGVIHIYEEDRKEVKHENERV